MSLNEICSEMKALGFEYGSFVNPLYTSYNFTPHIQSRERAFFKPLGKVLWFSRITETDTTELTLEWKEWVQMEDFEVEEYEHRGLLFAKVDTGRITTESHLSFGKGGAWRQETAWMPAIKWHKVASEFAGITVCPAKLKQGNLFSTWDVDTLAVWDPSCITETRTFNNSGAKWTYNSN